MTPATLSIRTAKGQGTIRGLRVAQPEGFGSGDAIAFEEIHLDFDVSSLASGDPYVIERVSVAAPEVTYVVNERRQSNLGRIQQNLARYESDDVPADAAPGEPDVRIRIDRLEVERGRIEADLRALGLGRTTAKLPTMEADGVGGSRGATPDELAVSLGGRFLERTMSAISVTAIGSTLDRTIEQGTKTVRGLLDALRGR